MKTSCVFSGKAVKQKLKIYHVHVYRVTGKAEITTYSTSSKQAKEMALEAVKHSKDKFKKSDCKYIALDFKEEK